MQPSNREKLGIFTQRARELKDRRLVRTTLANLQFTISWDAASQLLKYALPRVDEEDLRSYLLTFRHFISKGEPAFIDSIFNICHQHLQSEELVKELTKAREEWRNTFKRMGPIAVTINQKHLTGEYLLDLWINGVYFHNDTSKAAELHRLLGSGASIVKMKFLEVLADLTQIILYVAAVVEHALRVGLFQLPAIE